MGRLKFSATAGALIRKQFRRELEKVCFENDLELDIRENKGFFESDYFIKITGEDHILLALEPALKDWLDRISGGSSED